LEQTGQSQLIQIDAPVDLEMIFGEYKSQHPVAFFAYEGGSFPKMKVILKKVFTENRTPVENIWLLIGSEGGLSEAEANQLAAMGFCGVGLGEQILRVETACMAMLSILKYELSHF
jgi:16S rRNA (uracil1498-N3)-methyltransferase